MESEKKKISAAQIIQEVMSAAEAAQSEHGDEGSEKGGEEKSTILQKYSPQLVKMILELLCDESVSICRYDKNIDILPVLNDLLF